MASDCLKIWVQQQGCRREFLGPLTVLQRGLRSIHSAAQKVQSIHSAAKEVQVHPQCCRKGAGLSTVLPKRCRFIHSAAKKEQVSPQCCKKGAGPSTVLQERCRSTLEIYVHYFTELLCRGGLSLVHR